MAEENKEENLELEEALEELAPQEDTLEVQDESQSDTPKIDAIEENPEFVKKKKKNIVKIALFAVIGVLVVILLAGITMYFLGFFDPEEMPKEQMKKSSVSKVIETEEPKFSLKDINTKNLNKQLAELTNKTILKEQEAQKIQELEEEKKKLEEEKRKQQEELAKEEEKLANAEQKLLKEKELLKEKQNELLKQKEILDNLRNEALMLKEEMIKQRDNMQTQDEELLAQINKQNRNTNMNIKNEENKTSSNLDMKNPIDQNKTMMKETINETSFVLLINVAKIKGNLYKEYLDSIITISSDVKLCRDDMNNIEIYFGPFENMDTRSNIYNMLLERNFDNSYEVELTQEEFDKRCNY